MNKNRAIGLILLAFFVLAIFGSIFNGTFENLGDKNVGYYLGFFGTLGLLLVFGIINLTKKTK